MATIEKRVNARGEVSYRVKVRMKGHPPESDTFKKLTDARQWAARVESDMRAGRHFGLSRRYTFSNLADEYMPHAKDKDRLAHWVKVFGAESLDTITPSKITKERDRLLSEATRNFSEPATYDPEIDSRRTRSKRSGATVSRYLAALSVCLAYGVKTLGWIERNPCERVQKPQESKGRVRFLSDDERVKLLDACRPHEQLYLAVVLSLSTGARQGEIMSLRWPQVNLAERTITLHKTKNGDRRVIPLVGEALGLLKGRARVRSLHDDRIFPASSKARKSEYLDLNRPWRDALKAAGIANFHWHDLRHTAASYLVMSGVSLVEVSKILGHRTLAMVSRYSHLSNDHVVEAGEKLAARLGL